MCIQWFRHSPHILDVSFHLLEDCGKEAIDFLRDPLGDKLDPPIGKIANESGDVEVPGECPAGVAKADALYPARIVDATALWMHTIPGRRSLLY
jgi:hypothetical protein